MKIELFAILISALTTLLIFGVNILTIYWLSKGMKLKDFKYHKVLLNKSLKLAGIAAAVSFVLILILGFINFSGFAFISNSIVFLINAAVFIYAGMKIFEEDIKKILLLWVFVFFIDFLAGILISVLLNLIV